MQALHLLRSRAYLPDLLLLDVQMPNKTGYEVPAPPPIRRRCTHVRIIDGTLRGYEAPAPRTPAPLHARAAC